MEKEYCSFSIQGPKTALEHIDKPDNVHIVAWQHKVCVENILIMKVMANILQRALRQRQQPERMNLWVRVYHVTCRCCNAEKPGNV